jgi:hypothetical protein
MWPFRRRVPCASEEAVAAADHADRALIDVQNLDMRVAKVAEQSAEIKRVNHIAAAVAMSIRRA